MMEDCKDILLLKRILFCIQKLLSLNQNKIIYEFINQNGPELLQKMMVNLDLE